MQEQMNMHGQDCDFGMVVLLRRDMWWYVWQIYNQLDTGVVNIILRRLLV